MFAGLFALCADPRPAPSADLAPQVERLSAEVRHLRLENSMPALILDRHRESVCYIHGIYSFSRPTGPRVARIRFSGTGFVVADGLIATNRHVVQPWFEDAEAESLMRRGAHPHLEKLLAFFPNHPEGVELSQVTVSPDADVAVARFDQGALGPRLHPLPLADGPGVPGGPVVVVGYPLGITAMVAKSPRPIYRRLVFRDDGIHVARELAALSLIRPSATHGHLGDVVGDTLIYDAVTAHGGSGGPVFNHQGRVIGVNAAYLDGFSGSTLGISVNALRPLIEKARR